MMACSRFSSLPEWLAWQETLHPTGIELGLDRCRAVAERMQFGRIGDSIITVAGTNGKGSSVALLEAIYAAAGYRIASYTSPHLLRYNERMRLDRQPVADERLCAAFQRVDVARGNTSLTYFEFGTLAAFSLFAETKPEICIIEVGLGGRLDAVNLIDADVALITAIDLDHQDWLGTSRDAIAWEKAGIMRPGRPTICSDADAPPALLEASAQLNCPLRRLGVDFHFEIQGDEWSWWNVRQRLLGLPSPALAGAHQYRNAAGVLQVIADLVRVPVAAAAIHEGLQTVHVPGRYQLLPGDIEYRLDVAHNPAAAKVLAATAGAESVNGSTYAIFGIMADKDAAGFIAELDAVIDAWHLVTLPGARAAPAAKLAALCRQQLGRRKPVQCHESMAVARAVVTSKARPGDRVIVTGSHLAVGEFLSARESMTTSDPSPATT